MRSSVVTTTLIAAVFGLAGCGASTDTATGPASSSDTRLRPVQQVAESVFRTCQDGDMDALRDHLTEAVASLDWEHTCAAVRDHHMTFRVGVASSPTATTAAVHATMRSDTGRHDDDWEFMRDAHGWELAAPPEMFTGGWDHDDHRWLSSSTPSTPTTAHAPHTDGAGPHGYTPSTTSSSTSSSAPTRSTTGGHEVEPPATHLGQEPDAHDAPASMHDEGEREPDRAPPTATTSTNAVATTVPHRDDATSHDSGEMVHDDFEH